MAEIRTLGPVGLNPLGEYNSQTEYEKLDVVLYQGSSYVALKPVQGIVPTNAEYWQKLVSGGVGVDDIVDNLESNDSDKPLSANQGRILNNEVNNLKNVLKFHAVAGSAATYVVEFPNGKNLLVDTGMPNSWNSIKEAIDNLGITKFDYFIITHAHTDHIGNIQRFIDNYDFSDCVCWVGMKPDYINHSSVILDGEEIYDGMITLLQTNGLNPIVPINNSYYDIDNDTKLRFLNTDTTIAENYYSANVLPEYQTSSGVNFNHFSLITEIMYKKDIITLTGDIERINEQYYYPYMHKTSLLILPHHGINRDYYNQFYYATMPKFAYASYIATDSSWIRRDTKEFNFAKELDIKLLSSYNSVAVDGLHTFISNGYTLKSLSTSSGINEPSIEEGKLRTTFVEFMNYTTQLPNATTINDIFNNMNDGDTLFTSWANNYATDYQALYNELTNIFPDFSNITNKLNLKFRKTRADVKEIKIYNDKISYTAQSRGAGVAWGLISGNGIINENIVGINNLISRLKQLPLGHYALKNYKDDIGDVLSTTGNYILSIDIIEKWVSGSDTVVIAFITGSYRTTEQPSGSTAARTVIGYISTNFTPNYIWYKVN